MVSLQMPPKHPFDEPYGLIKALQADITELRANLKAEKDTRMQEVTAMAREIEILHQQLTEQRRENKGSFDRLSAALTSETTLRGKQMANHEERINGLVAMHEELKASQEDLARTLLNTTNKVDTEIRDRKAACEDLENKLKKEIDDREAACLALSNRLDDANDMNKVDFSKRDEVLRGIMAGMQSAGRALGLGSSSPPAADPAEATAKLFGRSDFGASMGSTQAPSPGLAAMAATPSPPTTAPAPGGTHGRDPSRFLPRIA